MFAVEDALRHALPDRRGFMRLTGCTLTGFAEVWMNVEPAEASATFYGGRIGDDFVDQMEAGLPRLRLLEAAYGGQRACRLLDAELGMVNEVLSKSSYTSGVARRLHALAAELGRVAGFACFDAGLHSAAQRYWVAAVHAAHAAGDRVQGANILKSMSLQCHDFGCFGEALRMAQCAREGVGQVTPRTAAMLALREARARAAMGEAGECERLIAAADKLIGLGFSEDDPAFIGYFDEAEFHAQAGSCYLDLGWGRHADDHLTSALERLPRTKVRDRATYLTRRADAQRGLGNVEEAAALLAGVVSLVQQAPSRRNVDRLLTVRNRLPASAARRELDEHLNSITSPTG
ncbi:transcriptional regulator [Sphaerisporangium album]|uniref:Transcriptional regulator n=2 Tax=Sphaerisporangium album TaxID=509200 RepID=A0A367EGP0_9ACTN|nr:transcriptional regulator [Sphaerisporangium album]